MTDNEIAAIVVLLTKLKKDRNWLLNFILDSSIKPREYVRSEMSVHEMLHACSDHLCVKILQELRGIERDYDCSGYPAGFDSLPAVKIPEVKDEPDVMEALKVACNEQGIVFDELTPIQRLFSSHFRCPNCKMVPLHVLDMTYPKRPRCGNCGCPISFRSTGKWGRLRRLTAMYAARNYGGGLKGI